MAKYDFMSFGEAMVRFTPPGHDRLGQAEELQLSLLDAGTAAAVLLPRPMDAYKGTCGRILVVAGSRGMTGAAAAKRASRSSMGGGGSGSVAVSRMASDR